MGKLKQSSGIAILNVLVLIGLIGIMTFTILSLQVSNLNVVEQQKMVLAAGLIKEKLIVQIASPSAWKETMLENSAVFEAVENGVQGEAPAGVNNLLDLKDDEGRLFYSSKSLNAGFTLDAEPCQNFSLTEGTIDCPFRYEVRLHLRRPVHSRFMEMVNLKLLYSPGPGRKSFNADSEDFSFNYFRNVSSELALDAACESMEGSFSDNLGKCSSLLTQKTDCTQNGIYEGPIKASSDGRCVSTKNTTKACPENQVVTGFDDHGPICGPVPDASLSGAQVTSTSTTTLRRATTTTLVPLTSSTTSTLQAGPGPGASVFCRCRPRSVSYGFRDVTCEKIRNEECRGDRNRICEVRNRCD